MRKHLGCTIILLASTLLGQEVRFPFSSRLVFNSDFQGNHEIYMLQNNTLTRLTDHPAWDEYPVPSNDGDRIVFTSDRSGNFDIYVMDLKTRQVRQVTRDVREERDPSWSFDDRFIYYIVRIEGEWIPRKVSVASEQVSQLFPGSDFPSIVTPFQSHLGGSFFFTAKTLLGWRVAKYDVASSKFIKLTPRGTCRPKISLDDKQIAYVSHEDDGIGDVWVMNPDGSRQHNLTPDRKDFIDYYPVFSPDNQWIAFSSSPKEKGKSSYDLNLLHVPTGKVTPIFASSGNDMFPYWWK